LEKEADFLSKQEARKIAWREMFEKSKKSEISEDNKIDHKNATDTTPWDI